MMDGERRRSRRWGVFATGAAVAFGAAIAALFWRRQTAALVAWFAPYVRTSSNPKHPVLIVNRWSGDGRAERVDILEVAHRAGIETVMLERGDDLVQLAEDAVANGADAIGMAGGDGSLGLVAGVAIEHDVPFFCVPVGTRNHFALDLGLDRDDPPSALAAVQDGEEIRIDCGSIGGRTFLNNVSFGLYADAVHREEYRVEKEATVAAVLAEYAADPSNQPPIHFETPDGRRYDRTPLLLVSNNVYLFSGPPDYGRRLRLDSGTLGIGSMTGLPAGASVATTKLADRKTFHQWAAASLELESDEQIRAGVDGEALTFDSPLVVSIRPRELRVLVPAGTRPGYVPPGEAAAARLIGLGDVGGVLAS